MLIVTYNGLTSYLSRLGGPGCTFHRRSNSKPAIPHSCLQLEVRWVDPSSLKPPMYAPGASSFVVRKDCALWGQIEGQMREQPCGENEEPWSLRGLRLAIPSYKSPGVHQLRRMTTVAQTMRACTIELQKQPSLRRIPTVMACLLINVSMRIDYCNGRLGCLGRST